MTGRVGQEAIRQVRDMPGVEIVMGMTHRNPDEILNIFSTGIEGIEWVGYDVDAVTLADLVKRRTGVELT